MIEDVMIAAAVDDLVLDLRTKADEISKAGQYINENKRVKVNAVINKTVLVLNSAANMAIESAQTINDVQEIKLGLEVAKNKAQFLYDNALKKIEEIKKEDTQEVLNNEPIVDDYLCETNVLNNSVNVENNENFTSNQKAINILKGWLEPKNGEQ